MGDVGGELPLGGEGGLKAAEQPVEGVRQVLELVVGAVQREAPVKVEGGDVPCGCRDRAQRAQYRPAITQPSPADAAAMMARVISDATRSWLFSASACCCLAVCRIWRKWTPTLTPCERALKEKL